MPVGSIYLSLTTDNPTNLFGGTWERIKDTFLLAAGDTYTLGNKGGASTHIHSTGNHTLTVNEMPAHTHPLSYRVGGGGGSTWYTDPGTAEAFNTNAATAIGNTGGGAAHNHGDTGSTSNMPPYLVVYIWKRIS